MDDLTLAQLFLMLRAGDEDAPKRSHSQAEIDAHVRRGREEALRRREQEQLAEYRAAKRARGEQGDGVSTS